MPNTPNDFTTFFNLNLTINSTSARKSRTESYLMAGEGWDDNAEMGAIIAKMRASILGRDAELTYASISQWGPGRPAQCVLASPLPGGLGVKWDDAAYLESDLVSNAPETTLRIRQETLGRENIIRQFVCIPDGLLNARKYVGGAVDGVLDLGAYDTITTPAGVTLPQQNLWVYGTPVAGVTTHLLWPDAMKLFLKCLHNFTWWGKTTTPTTAVGRPWKFAHFRGVGNVKMGRPILR